MRRYSDFVKLREFFEVIFPDEVIPMLPNKIIEEKLIDNNNPKVINRTKALNRFLRKILEMRFDKH
jgi:hypothetical protein